jgi:photosystem II stability/assembly factor-like uncharacterized protein
MKHLKIFLSVFIFFNINSLFSQWIVQNSNTNLSLYSVSFVDSIHGFIAGDSGLILNTKDGGSSWLKQTTHSNALLQSISFCDSLNGWSTGMDGTILKTSDGGRIWNIIDHDTAKIVNHFKVQCINPLTALILRFQYTIDYVEDFRIWKTGDGGESWTEISPSESQFYEINDMFFVDSSLGFACGFGIHNDLFSYQIHKTNNSGLNWSTRSFNAPAFGAIRRIYFADDLNGWATDWDTLYHTTDGGDSWDVAGIPVFNDLTDLIMFENVGYASRSFGKILKTIDGGANWSVQPSSPDNFVEDIEFVNPNTGWAVGWNGMIFHTSNGGVSSIRNVADDLPDSPLLYQNYPNPFNPSTTISYYLAKRDNIELSLLNALGQKIETLFSGVQNSGFHKVNINGLNLSSGIYFYRLKTHNFAETRKCVILK